MEMASETMQMNKRVVGNMMPPLAMLAAMVLAAAGAWMAQRLPAPAATAPVPEPGAQAAFSPPPDTTAPEAALPATEEISADASAPPRVFIEVNIPATEMTVYENDVPVYRRRVAVGQGVYPTPALTGAVKKVEWNPWWYPPPYADWAKGSEPTPPGPGNPLGLVKIPLSGDILFHGTNKEWTVGTPASHGCMRMMNREVMAIAWYLQRNFSEQRDPALREIYRRNRSTTYAVKIDPPVPAEIVYRPVESMNGSLFFYPDHYNRLGGRRKAGILGALLRRGLDITMLDDAKVEALAKNWPPRGTEVSVRDLMLEAPPLSLLGAPECE